MTPVWKTLRRLTELPTDARAELFAQADTPFNRYEFLSALELSGSVGEGTGWLPNHQIYTIGERILGLLIAYQKEHSYGEYVFDWAWADAYHQHQIPYYPKIVVAIPFTPVPCTKWFKVDDKLTVPLDISEAEAVKLLSQRQADSGISGVHHLFSAQRDPGSAEPDWINREGHQFHWFNRHPHTLAPYTCFEAFLAGMTARRRKTVKKERLKVSEQGIHCLWRTGTDVQPDEIEAFYRFYQLTYYKRGQQGYLNRAFFELIFQTMPTHIRLLVCYRDTEIVGTALYFVDSKTLYGRYWGGLPTLNCLHFEACYYQGIEYAIEHKLHCFNPGTQGEHKIPRGFEPITTHSHHRLYLEPFHQAVANFCQEEALHNRAYMAQCRTRLPFSCPTK